MFRLIYGQEDYLVDLRLNEIESEMFRRYGDVETVIIDGEEAEKEELLASLEFSSLFANARLTVWKRAPIWGQPGEKKAALMSGLREDLPAYIDNLPDGLWVVATAREVSDKNPLVKELKRRSAVEEIKVPDFKQRQEIIYREACNRGLELESKIVEEMARGGQDLYYIVTLLDKLALLPDQRVDGKILAEEGIVEAANVFALSDAIVLGNRAKALKELRRLWQAGQPYLMVLATINRQLMTLAKVKGWIDEGLDYKEVAARLGQKKEYKVRRDYEKAEKVEWERIRYLFRLYWETDVLLKTSRMNYERAFEYLIFKA